MYMCSIALISCLSELRPVIGLEIQRSSALPTPTNPTYPEDPFTQILTSLKFPRRYVVSTNTWSLLAPIIKEREVSEGGTVGGQL
jgi:hypothetical protein